MYMFAHVPELINSNLLFLLQWDCKHSLSSQVWLSELFLSFRFTWMFKNKEFNLGCLLGKAAVFISTYAIHFYTEMLTFSLFQVKGKY